MAPVLMPFKRRHHSTPAVDPSEDVDLIQCARIGSYPPGVDLISVLSALAQRIEELERKIS